MKLYLNLVRQNLLFYVLYMIVLIVGSAVSMFLTKIDSFVILNKLHNNFLDKFFIIVTYLGDGSVVLIVTVILITLCRQQKLGMQLLLAYVISGIIVQIFKISFAAPRPKTIISEFYYHYFINGITHTGWNSFPSGHATSIFAMVTILILFFRKCGACLLLLLTALFVAYSRIYLGHHFLDDVIAGSVLGVITGSFIYCVTLSNEWPLRFFGQKRNKTRERHILHKYFFHNEI